MTNTTAKTSSPMHPLLRSIARELRERSATIQYLELRFQSLSQRPKLHAADLDQVTAELAFQRRELRHSESELVKLGCERDGDHPGQWQVPANSGSTLFDPSLEETCMRRLETGTAGAAESSGSAGNGDLSEMPANE